MLNDTFITGGKRCFVYSAPSPEYLLIQPADERELELLDSEAGHIGSQTDKPFVLAAFEVKDWNSELSPWEAPPVFGNVPFGSGAADTLAFVEDTLILDIIKRCSLKPDIPVILGGYSLAGLFSLWAAYSTDRFAAAAGVSPSVWFPGWTEFASERTPSVRAVYLSLGKKEEKARNIIMASVGDNIRRYREILLSKNLPSILEWNEGNHFSEPEARTAKGFVWCINAV